MTSMEVSFDASESPEAQPTSLAAEPSSPSAAPASSRPPPPAVDAQPAHRAKVTRTYGRPKPVEDVTPAKELAATEGLALDRNSTLVIPDSEPASKPQHPSSDSVDDGDTTMRAGHGQATSSPTRRDVQSTDPTSEDEEPVRPANSRSKTSLPVHADTDADSSDSDNDAASGDDTGALAFLKRRPAIKDLLANVDRVFDSRLKDTTAATTVVFPTSSTLPPLTVTNESGSSRPASSSQRSPPRWRAASPSSPSHDLDDIEALLTSTQSVESEDVVPTARSRARKPRAILDSDDEEAEEEKAPQRNAAPRPSSSGDEGVRPSLSKQDRVRQLWQKKVEANEAKERERQMKLAAARGEEYVEPEPVTLVEDLIEDDSDGRTGKKKAKARKSSEKKAKVRVLAPRLDDFRMLTCALVAAVAVQEGARRDEPRHGLLEPPCVALPLTRLESLWPMLTPYARRHRARSASRRDPQGWLVRRRRFEAAQRVRRPRVLREGEPLADIFSHSSSLPPPTVDRTVSISAQPETITLSSSSDAIVTSSPSRDVAQTPVFKLSSKALGKQRASSPIADGDHATPVPHRARKPLAPAGWPERKRVPTPVAADDDEDEDLLAPDEMIRRDNEKREKARRSKEFQAKKLAAAKAAKAKAAQGNDSDTDLEIEMPGAPKRTARAASTQAEDTLAVFSRTPARPRNDPRKILARHAGIDLAHPPSEDALPSESQLDAAGHEFGRHLDTRFHENLASSRKPRPFGVKSSSRAKRAGVPEQITHEKLNGSTLEKARLQNLAMRTKKQTLARQAQQNKPELQSVDVAALIKSKREKEDQEDQEEEDEDGDYVDEDEEEEAQASMYAGSDSERDETGSGDDEPAPAVAVVKSAPGSDDEAEVDSEGELVMPPSSQNSERLRQATPGDADEEDEDEEMPPPATTRRPASKIRIVADDDDESRASDTPAPTELAPTEVARTATSDESQGAAAPAKVAFGALLGDEGDAGGFSQFFDSQFSQGADGDDEVRLPMTAARARAPR